MSKFVHLNVHSYYTLLSGASSIDDLLKKAGENNQDSIALTDTNALYGAINFYKKAIEVGIKPIIGSQIQDSENNRSLLLAKNFKGYQNLCSLITRLKLSEEIENKQNDNSKNEIPSFHLKEALTNPKDVNDLIIISDSIPILEHLSERNVKENLFVEVYPPTNKEERDLFRKLIDFSDAKKIPIVATNRAFFARRPQFLIHRILTAIRLLCTIETIPAGSLAPRGANLKPSEEMSKIFWNHPQAIENTIKIAEMCDLKMPIGQKSYPEYPFKNCARAEEILREICLTGLTERFSPSELEIAKSRLNYELDIIIKMGFADYFLIVWDIVNFARRERIPYVGRGSAADSLVSYLLRVTDVDPIKHNLYFERFLNPERIGPPDIDIDFCWKRRDRIIEFVYKRYGLNRVAMISTHNTFELRSSVRETGKALGYSESEMNKITDKIPHFDAGSLDQAFSEIPETFSIDHSLPYIDKIIRIAKKIGGFPRHLGIHPGGIVIAPDTLTNWTPLERATKGLIVTQYEMHSIEDLGLLKIDLLGQRSLSVIADTVEAVKKNSGNEINPEQILEDDEKTKALVREGKTIGVFQIESPGMRGILRKLRADDFEIVTAASSLIRPGPKDSGMMRKFIRRHLKKEPISYLHPAIKDVLGETYGVMVYQEDVMKMAQAVVGMSLGRADLLRRSMSAKKGATPLLEFEEEFFRGARERGFAEKIIKEIWRQMCSFAGYAFCKAHSASYTKISFQSAFLKVHYPAEFFAALISNCGGFYDQEAYINEARRWRMKLRIPSINESQKEWIGYGDIILCGFKQIKNLSQGSIDKILAERSKGKFSSPMDFFKRTQLPPSEVNLLIASGCLDSFDYSRPQINFLFERFLSQKNKSDTQNELFKIAERDSKIPTLREFSEEELFAQEYENLDVPIRFHPLKLFREKIKSENVIFANELAKHKNKMVRISGWMVTNRRVRTSKNELMKFVTLEDETDIYDVVLFPEVYKKYGAIVLTRGPYIIVGRVICEEEVCTIEASEIHLISKT